METKTDGLWGIAEVASYLGVSEMAVYKMTGPKARNRIPHVRLGGRLRFRRADIDRWLDLLAVSNLDTLAKARRAAARA